MSKPFFLPLLCLLCITGLSVMPSVKLPKFDLFSPDKLGHAFAYGLLVWLTLRAWRRAKGEAWRRVAWGVTLFAIAYGVLMEFVQGTFIPGRFYEYDDMLANAFGAVVAWALFAWRAPTTALSN